ncbi:uncharacterized protein LOC113316389 [Papaver somniferum]|uniref:uncharacterized protein LOC113316389 n=1 Tax=Papaver somniferum TaxID=3469 RepID=UPI000E7011AE|nr:uncharacterized protein LOC113316389 [Papaver somniferum]
MGIWGIPGFLGGDWNVTKSIADRNRVRGVSRAMRDFISFISNHDLVGLPLSGAKYTWSNFQENPYCSRIDRFLLNPLWEAMFSDTIQSAKPRPVSDHTPLMLSTTMMYSGARPFKLEIIWLESDDLKDKMQGWWGDLTFSGNPGYVFCKKLMAVKEYLKVWNKDSFGKVGKKMDEILVQIQEVDFVDEEGTATIQDRIQRINLKKDYIKWANLEHKRIQNKRKGQWIADGDKNTGFFHRIVNGRRRANNISCLRIDGDLTEDRSFIGEKLQEFYSDLYTEEEVSRPFMEDIQFERISEVQREEMET